MLFTRAELLLSGEPRESSNLLVAARRYIANTDESLTTEQLLSEIDGLTEEDK